MSFNSIDFAIFFPLVFVVYWYIFGSNLRWQNAFLVVVSYIFYGWWDYRFLVLILISTLTDYIIGLQLYKQKEKLPKKLLLFLSIAMNIGILGFFKYFHFFVDSFISAFSLFGYTIHTSSLDIILPVGISFYTFQTLSYTIDIYRNRIRPTSDVVAFSAFISFFPQLVAGPIERAGHLLPQFLKERSFDYALAVTGCRQILWGLFKKMVIADNCAVIADEVFKHHAEYPGSSVILGVFFFSIQIYCDFSGYSDIGIGISKLLGFNLKNNFLYPYFSKNIIEFWQRWHISLSTWFRDYVYIPLGGNRVNNLQWMTNILIVFVLSGLWHGANWNFIIWGLSHAILYLLISTNFWTNSDKLLVSHISESKIWVTLKIFSTFMSVALLWVLFRAVDIRQAMGIYEKIFSQSVFDFPKFQSYGLVVTTSILIAVCMVIEWLGRYNNFAIENLFVGQNKWLRWSFYSILVACISMYMQAGGSPFIYFQF